MNLEHRDGIRARHAVARARRGVHDALASITGVDLKGRRRKRAARRDRIDLTAAAAPIPFDQLDTLQRRAASARNAAGATLSRDAPTARQAAGRFCLAATGEAQCQRADASEEVPRGLILRCERLRIENQLDLLRLGRDDPTVVGGVVPCGLDSVVISSMASAGGSAKHANNRQVVAFGFDAAEGDRDHFLNELAATAP